MVTTSEPRRPLAMSGETDAFSATQRPDPRQKSARFGSRTEPFRYVIHSYTSPTIPHVSHTTQVTAHNAGAMLAAFDDRRNAGRSTVFEPALVF
jgi:hypothetical protein